MTLKKLHASTVVFVGMLAGLALTASPAAAQGRSCGPQPLNPLNPVENEGSVYNCKDTPNPLPPNTSIWTVSPGSKVNQFPTRARFDPRVNLR